MASKLSTSRRWLVLGGVGAGFAIFLLLWAVARRTHLPQEVHSKEHISVRAQANGQSGQHEPLRADSGRASSVAGESDAFPVVLRRLYRQQYQCAVDEDDSAFIMRAASELLPRIRGCDTAEIRRYIIEHSGEEAVCLFVACLRFDEREEVRSLLCSLACDREVSPTVRIAAVMGMIIPESDEMQAPGATHPISEMVSVGLLSVKPGLVRRPEFARTLAQALDGNELLIIERSSILTLDGQAVFNALLASRDAHPAAIEGLLSRLEYALDPAAQGHGLLTAGSYASDFFYFLSQSKADAQEFLLRILARSPGPAAVDYARVAWQQLGGSNRPGFPTDDALATMDPEEWERAIIQLTTRAREQALPGDEQALTAHSQSLAAVRSIFWTVHVQRDASKRLADNAISHNSVSAALNIARGLPKSFMREQFYRTLWEDRRVSMGLWRDSVLRAISEDPSPTVRGLYESFSSSAMEKP